MTRPPCADCQSAPTRCAASNRVAAEWYSAESGSPGRLAFAVPVGGAAVCRLPVCTYSLRGLQPCSRGVVLCGIRFATPVGRRGVGWQGHRVQTASLHLRAARRRRFTQACSRGVALCGIRSPGRSAVAVPVGSATVCRLPVCTYALRGGGVSRRRVATEWYSAESGSPRRSAVAVPVDGATVCRLPVCTYALRGGDAEPSACSRGVALCGIRFATPFGRRDAGW